MIPTRLFDLIYYQAANYPQKSAVKAWEDQQWRAYSTAESIDIIESLACGMIQKGVKSGTNVGIITHLGSPTWNFIDFALQMIGAIPVPLHASASTKQIEYILKDASITICFAADEPLAKLLIESSKTTGLNLEIFLLTNSQNYPSWENFLGNKNDQIELSFRKNQVKPEDLATIIYTSGTTGDPKGVMLSHYNILCNINSTAVLLPIYAGLRTLSYLPMSHIFERMVIFTYWMVGANIHYAKSVTTILEDLQKVRPHYFTTVPRLLERVYEKLMLETKKGGVVKKLLLKWAINLGERFNPHRKIAPWFWIKRKIVDLLVYRKWRNLIGGKVKGIVVGAAALQPRLGKLFSAAGIKIREGYGLTETSPVVSFNRFEPGGHHFGTVGFAIPGVDIRVVNKDENDEGDVQVKGPNIMMGYFNKPEETAKVIDKDGWFSTGDRGKFVFKHFLQITGRKKDIFKTTTGKYVAPYHVEQVLKSSDLISQCMVLGASRPYPGVLIIPNFNHLEVWCKANNVHWTGPQFMVLNPKVMARIALEIKEKNEHLSKPEKVRQFYLLHKEWSAKTGEYGPTLKLIRAAIRTKYSKEIEKLYASKDNLVPK